MRKLLLSVLAAALVAAAVLLAAAPAAAQFRAIYSGGSISRPQFYGNYPATTYGLGVGSRYYSGFRPGGFATTSLYTNPFMYRDPVTPQLYNLSPGARYDTVTRYGFPGTYVAPYNFAGYPGYGYPTGYNYPLGNYGGWPGSGGGPFGYSAPSGYAPLGARTGNYLDMRVPSYPVADVRSGRDVLYSSDPPRMRTQLYPAVPVSPNVMTGTDTTALITVVLPRADAEVWFEGVRTTRTGTEREYVSPPLSVGSKYTYQIRARWGQGPQARDVTRSVQVRAGDRVTVNFTDRE
jgi:uncharacterized protein (TIGR03000 family)